MGRRACQSINAIYLKFHTYSGFSFVHSFFLTNRSTDDKLNAAPKKKHPVFVLNTRIYHRYANDDDVPYMVLPELFVHKCTAFTWATRPAFQMTARRQVPIPPGVNSSGAKWWIYFSCKSFLIEKLTAIIFLVRLYFPFFRFVLAAAVFCVIGYVLNCDWVENRVTVFRFCLYRCINGRARSENVRTCKYTYLVRMVDSFRRKNGQLLDSSHSNRSSEFLNECILFSIPLAKWLAIFSVYPTTFLCLLQHQKDERPSMKGSHLTNLPFD